jgi:L-lactate dehydrogenase complex protein LldG
MRNPVLERVRERVTHKPVSLSPVPPLPFDAPRGSAEAVERLWAAWAELGIQAVRCLNELEAFQELVARLRERKVQNVLVDSRTARADPGLIEALEGAQLRVIGSVLPQEESARYAELRRWATAEAGVTDVVAAFADSGTLWVAGGAGGMRCASLLPTLHVALVRRTQVYPCMANWLAEARASGELQKWVEESSSIIAITGPSRTTDIEKTLVLGVHGPREVIAILIEEAQ